MILCACAQFQSEEPPLRQEAPIRAPQAVAATQHPQQVAAQVRNLLALAGLESVRAAVSDETGFVELFGEVPDARTRQRLIGAVKAIDGVRTVHTDLSLPPAPLDRMSEVESRSIWTGVSDHWLYLLGGLLILGALLWRLGQGRFSPYTPSHPHA